MLEYGEFPSLVELNEFIYRGIDYECIIDKHLYHPGALNDYEAAPVAIRKLPYNLLPTNPFTQDIILELLK